MRPADEIEKKVRGMRFSARRQVRERMLNDVLAAHDECERKRLGPEGTGVRRTIMKNRMTKLAAAAVLVAAAFAATNWFGWPLGGTVAWADVIERFRSVNFYSATVYFKEDAASEPKQVEFWVSSSGKARVRTGSQLLFATDGRIIAGYDLKARTVVATEKYDAMAEAMVGKLCQNHALSLDAIVSMVYRGTLKEVTPMINRDAMISADLLVFDIESGATPEWMRIWALRESRLPVRVRLWDPRDGACIEAVFTYSKEQPAEFFDADRFEGLMRTSGTTLDGSAANLAYAFLHDPGGRDYVPKDLFDRSGYHVPTVDGVGVTEHGAVWVVASQSQNRRPDGHVFWGFAGLEDTFDRTCRHIASTWRLDDVSVQVFVPEDYPFDSRVPEKLTLVCQVKKQHPDKPTQIIGRVEITDVSSGLWPADRLEETEYDLMLRCAWEDAASAPYDRCNRIVELVRKSDDAAKHAHEISRINLAILINEKQFDEADALAEPLWRIELERLRHPGKEIPSYEPFWDYIVAVAGKGRIDRAAEMVKQLRESQPDLSEFSMPARRHFSEALPREFAQQLGFRLVSDLFSKANLSLADVNRIAGFDVLENEDTRGSVPQGIRKRFSPAAAAWNQHLQELAAHYGTHPLEIGQIDLRRRDRVYSEMHEFVLPGLDEYRVSAMDGSLDFFVRLYRYLSPARRIRISGSIGDVRLQHDVVSRGPVAEDAVAKFVLSHLGLDIVEQEELAEVWIAECDGRELKSCKDVRSPLTEGATTTPGMPKYMAAQGIGVADLLAHLAEDQDVVVENSTGIAANVKLSGVAPNFKGETGEALAREWFRDNFGITFRKEQRTMSVWVIRSK